MEVRKRRGREEGERKEKGEKKGGRERGTHLELFPQLQVDHLLCCPLVIPGAHLVNVAGCPDKDRLITRHHMTVT